MAELNDIYNRLGRLEDGQKKMLVALTRLQIKSTFWGSFGAALVVLLWKLVE